MKTKHKFFKNRFIGIIAVILSIVLSGIVFHGCEKYENELLNEDILNSYELEDFIIAGADLQHSLAIFRSRLNKIDLSKLEVTYDSEGRKVVHLSSDLVGNFRIEDKVQMFNERKEALQEKFPQFISFKETEAKKYFQNSIENSVNVRIEFLKLGINFGTKLKTGSELWYGAENEVFMHSFLYDWVNDVNYVELWIIYYEDGTFGTYQHPQATSSWTTISYSVSNDQMYFPEGGSSSAVISLGHTHRDSSDPSPSDYIGNFPSSVDEFIWYNWDMYYY